MEQRSLIAGAAIAISAALGVFAVSRAVVTDDDVAAPPPPPPASVATASSPATADTGTVTGSIAGGGDVSATPTARVEIDISGSAYTPSELTVAPGTEVVWINRDSLRHTVTGSDGTINSPTLEQGDTFSFVFTTPGTFAYYCQFHPNMTATITVEG